MCLCFFQEEEVPESEIGIWAVESVFTGAFCRACAQWFLLCVQQVDLGLWDDDRIYFVKAYPELFTLTVREKKKIFVMVVAYCVLALFAKAARTQRNMAGVLVLVLAVFTVTSFGNIFLQGKYMCGLLSALLVVSIMLNVSYQYSYEKDYLSEFAAEEESLDKLESNTDKAVLAAGDSGVYRYDQYGALPYDNTSMYMGTNSTAYYFSLANSSISDFSVRCI